MPEPRAKPPVVDARVPFGIPEIDEMLEGGLVPHRPYLIVGPSGTGKTTLALQFLCEGIRRGEPSLYVTIEDPPNEVRVDHRALPPEIDRIDVFDAIPDVMRYEHIPFKDISSVRDVIPFQQVPNEIRKTPEFTSVEITVSALEQLLRTEVQRRGYVRLVVDSLTALQYFCMKGIEPMSGAQAFLRFLSSLRTTSLLTVEAPLEDAESPERSLARGEVRLFRWELEGATVRAIGVEKFRGSSHDVRLHPYRIGPKGIDINLDLTISRDTRRLVESAISVVAPALVPGGPEPTSFLGSLSEEVRDLLTLGVDVRPVRVEVEAALAAAREGRADESVTHVVRLSSLTISLAQSLLHAPGKERGLSKTAREAFQRIAQRADAARGGVPPTRLPPPDVLEEQLSAILSQIGERAPAIESPAPPVPPAKPAPVEVAPAASPPAGEAAPPTPVAPMAPPEEPGAEEPIVVPAVATPAPPAPAEYQPPPPPSPPEQPPSPLMDGEPRPLPNPPSPHAGAGAAPRDAAPTVAASVSNPPARIAAKLPPARTEPPAPGLVEARSPPSVPEQQRRGIPARPLPEPPPLPTPYKPAPRDDAGSPPTAHPSQSLSKGPPAAEVPAVGPSPPAGSPPGRPAVAPAPHRRKRAAPAKRVSPAPVQAEPGPALPGPEGTPPVEAAAPKPKRRPVRKRKAPTVVTAIPEAMPAAEPITPPAPESPPRPPEANP